VLTCLIGLAVAPDIPTFVEMGLPALSFSEWSALFAPKGTPADIVGKLNAAAVEALADPAAMSDPPQKTFVCLARRPKEMVWLPLTGGISACPAGSSETKSYTSWLPVKRGHDVRTWPILLQKSKIAGR
jgi:hypothetical protein